LTFRALLALFQRHSLTVLRRQTLLASTIRYSLDFQSPSHFVHELPEQFDLVARIGGLRAWDGSDVWLSNPLLTSLYRHTLIDYVSVHTPRPIRGDFVGVAGCTEASCGLANSIWTGVRESTTVFFYSFLVFLFFLFFLFQ
jgi:hypothetical protein